MIHFVRNLTAAVLAAMLISFPAWANNVPTPKEVVESTVDQILNVLESREDKTLLSDKDIAAVNAIGTERIDYRYIASRLLGRSGWTGLNAEQQDSYTKRYSEWIELYVANQLSKYHGQTINYDHDEEMGRYVVVKLIVDNDGKPVHLDFTLRQPKGQPTWMIIDFTVEGISIPKSVESDFRTLIAGPDGYTAVLARLDTLIESKKEEKTGN